MIPTRRSSVKRERSAAAPLDPAAGQPMLRLPLQSPQRLLRSLCRSGGRTPSAGAILLVHCVQHGGVRWHKQLPRRSAAAPVSIAQASIVLPLSGLLAQDPPAQTPPPTARNARPSCSSTTAAGLSTAAGGRRIRRKNDRRGGQVVFAATTSRQAAQRPTAAYSVTKIPPGNGSASVSETRVNFRERQRRDRARQLLKQGVNPNDHKKMQRIDSRGRWRSDLPMPVDTKRKTSRSARSLRPGWLMACLVRMATPSFGAPSRETYSLRLATSRCACWWTTRTFERRCGAWDAIAAPGGRRSACSANCASSIGGPYRASLGEHSFPFRSLGIVSSQATPPSMSQTRAFHLTRCQFDGHCTTPADPEAVRGRARLGAASHAKESGHCAPGREQACVLL